MEEEKQYWSMDEIIAITEKVQEEEVEYQGKFLKLHWCELTESEEPKVTLPADDLPEEEKTKMYIGMAAARVKSMIAKADEKNPDDKSLKVEDWDSIPTTLRYAIQNKILGAGTSFQNG